MKRSFLFLSGPYSPFFAKLGEELVTSGHRVLKINFTPQDKYFWDGEITADYKHHPADFGAYISNVARLRKITDMVIFGENDAFAESAIEALKNMKIRLYVFDKGYFGDNWITLEDRVFGSKTIFPKDPRFYLRQAENAKGEVRKFGSVARAAKFYRLQYKLFGKSAGFPRLSVSRSKRIKIDAKLEKNSYFLADFELSRKASFLRNFAANAPEDAILAFYSPVPISLSQGAKTWELAAKYNVTARVNIIAGKAFRPLVKNAIAYITNNNIEAIVAIKKSRPVLALDSAIYNINGLTSHLPLADFWNRPGKPDAEIFKKFRAYVLEKTQINGCFYNKQGIELAVATSLTKILGREVVIGQSQAFDVN